MSELAEFRELYERFALGDRLVLQELFAPDAVCHVSGESILAGTYRGIEAISDFFLRTLEMRNSSYLVEIHDVLGSEQHVVVLVRVSAKSEGRAADILAVDVFHLNATGQVREYWSLATRDEEDSSAGGAT